MITFKPKLFTDLELARGNSGLLEKAIEHIFKIVLRFDYSRDGNKHRADLFNDFIGPIFKDTKISRNKSKGLWRVYDFYFKEVMKKDRLLSRINNNLKEDYGLKKDLTEDDLDQVLEILQDLMNSESEQEIRTKILRIKPWKN
jgi:hypothetical protein